jgi:hypothetical protein
MRLVDYWLAQALLALWVSLVTLLYYGLLANSILARFAGP